MWLRGRRFIIRLFFTMGCFMVSFSLLTHSHLAMAEVDTQHTVALTYCIGANDSMREGSLVGHFSGALPKAGRINLFGFVSRK